MAQTDVRAALGEFQDQPEEIRRVFIYVLCETMVQSGTLLFRGAFSTPRVGVTLIYQNPDSSEIFEIIKPKMDREEEQAIREHIAELLQDSAHTA